MEKATLHCLQLTAHSCVVLCSVELSSDDLLPADLAKAILILEYLSNSHSNFSRWPWDSIFVGEKCSFLLHSSHMQLHQPRDSIICERLTC